MVKALDVTADETVLPVVLIEDCVVPIDVTVEDKPIEIVDDCGFEFVLDNAVVDLKELICVELI